MNNLSFCKNYEGKSLKRNGLNILYSFIIAIFILLTLSFSNKNFFLFDDGTNEMLPFLRSIGKIWSKGEIPFIIKDTFIGQNQMVDTHRIFFMPQTIILSILSTKVSFTTMSRIMAFTNLFLMSFFSLKIGEALSIKRSFNIVMSFLFCISPVFIYIHLSSWWVVGIAQVWFVGALASILLLRKEFCVKYLIMNVVCAFSLLGWPQASVAYFFLAFSFLLETLLNKEYKKSIIFVIISIGVLLIGINIYSEYIMTSEMFTRYSGFGNFGNFLVPTFNQIFMTFSPVYYNFMNDFSGYSILYIPLGYSSIYILFLICFNKNFWDLFYNKNIKFISFLLLFFFILCQIPSQFGLLRWPFRFITYFSEVLIIFSIYGINISELKFTKKRIEIFSGILLLSFILAFFSIEKDFGKIFQVNLVFLVLTIVYLYVTIKEEKFTFIPSIIYSIFILFFMLFIQKDAEGILSVPRVPNHISMKNNFSTGGYLLSLTNGRDPKENIEDLFTAQFLLFDIKAINGYSPVGNKKIAELLDTEFAQSYFKEESTVNKLAEKYNNKVCYFDLMNIDSITILKEKLTENMKNKIENCGYKPKEVDNKEVLYFTKKKNTLGNVSYTNNGLKINKMLIDKNNIEKYSITTSNESSEIIFSKVYWPGYRAYINGKRIEISDEKGLIKINKIPLNLNNATLELKYFPKSWRITLWLAFLGVLDIILVLFYVKKEEKKWE